MNIICIQEISPDAYFIRFSTPCMQTGKFSNDIASILFGTSHVIYHIKDILSECTLFVFTIYIAFCPNFTLTNLPIFFVDLGTRSCCGCHLYRHCSPYPRPDLWPHQPGRLPSYLYPHLQLPLKNTRISDSLEKKSLVAET